MERRVKAQLLVAASASILVLLAATGPRLSVID